MDNITTSLDMSKKLRDAGWKQDKSEYQWAVPNYDTYPFHPEANPVPMCWHKNDSMFPSMPRSQPHPCHFIDSPIAEEILISISEKMVWTMATTIKKFAEFVRDKCDIEDTKIIANAAAAMWIYLKENNLLPND